MICLSFRIALESPFNNLRHVAIPPSATLCDFRGKPTRLSHRFVWFWFVLLNEL